MIKKYFFIFIISLSFFLLLYTLVNAQSINMLNGPYAEENTDQWIAFGDALIEKVNGNPCFTIRDGGYFIQDITLTDNDVGKYALLVGIVSSDHIDSDGKITGLPYLYAYMMNKGNLENIDDININEYLLVTDMLYTPFDENEWIVIWDIFSVPKDTGTIRLFLKQAEQQGAPHNGSRALFDDLGIYLFTSFNDAEAFVNEYYYQ